MIRLNTTLPRDPMIDTRNAATSNAMIKAKVILA